MPRVLNPNPPKYSAQALIDRLTAYFAANPNARAVTFDQIRASHASLAGLTDGQIDQLAQDGGYKVEP